MDPFRNIGIPVEGRQAAAAVRPRTIQTDSAPSQHPVAQRTLNVEEYYSSESSSSDGDYSDSSSSYHSSSTGSSESIPEWETHIDNHGELFYVQFSSNLPAAATPDTVKESPSSEERQEMLKKKKKSRLSRLLKRRQGKSSKGNGHEAPQTSEPNCESPVYLPTKVHGSPADDWSDWTSFTLELEVHPPPADDISSATGRRNKNSNLCESLLGFVPGVTQSVEWHGQVSLRQRVIVDKLVPGGPLHQGYAHVQQGDWLEKLNGQNVTHRDLNDILSAIDSRAIVELNFRRRPANVACGGSTDSHQDSSEHETGRTLPHGVLLLSHENVTETSAETADIIYRWSRANSSAAADDGTDARSDPIDPVLKWRGAAVTLAHLMPQLTGSVPSSSTFVIEGNVIHLSYIIEGTALFLVAAPASWCENSELHMITKQLGRLFQFQYGSIRKALTEQRFADEIRRLFDGLFNVWLQRSNKTGRDPVTGDSVKSWDRLASYFASGGQWLALPSESHLDVTLTLNQMEAIDYEDWDEEAITVQRCATIIGSAVYCLGYLVATTLTAKCLDEVGTFLRWNQVLEMSQRRRLSSLIIWREIYSQGNEGAEQTFILVVGSGHTLIVALLECGGVNQPWDNNPDTFIIEEVQFFLDELEHLELETTCSQILNGPHNPVLVTNLENVDNKTSQTLSFSITPGLRPTLINYLFLDFGVGMFMAPTLAGAKFLNQFRITALNIHKLFQQTLRAKVDLQRPDWGGPWSEKSLVALQEVSLLFTNLEAHGSLSGAKAISKDCGTYWVTGRLFTTPAHKELYVCYEDGVAQDILDLAFHLGFAALH